jgi:hypothetical protein
MPRTKLALLAIVMVLLPGITGCGVILLGGTTEPVTVLAEPGGATVTTIPATSTFTTPATIELERKNNYVLRFDLLGYETGELAVNKKVRVGVVVLDVLFGVVPVLVDAVTGGLYELLPKTATVSLVKINAAVPGPDTLEVTFTMTDRGDRTTATVFSDTPGVTLTVIPQN